MIGHIRLWRNMPIQYCLFQTNGCCRKQRLIRTAWWSGLTLVYVIFDSSVLDAYKVIIESIDLSKNISMREVYGMNKSLSR